MKRAWAVALALGVAACSSGGTGGSGSATAARAVTATTVDPVAVFDERLSRQLNGETADFVQSATDMAKTLCKTLNTATQVTNDDAPNDTPKTDSSVLAAMSDMALGIAMDSATKAGTDPAVMATIMRTGTAVFCPQYSVTVETWLQAQPR